ncbi:MAG TPA: tail fiber domain-containing protein [Pyrinomonadaceae bacterium]|nr:tail fiber domain-containing protein [Pyrinomonadaceae bacterium]
MTYATRLFSGFVLLLLAVALSARAQTVPVEVTNDGEGARFSATGKVRMMQVEVYGPGGEMVFVSGFVEGRAVEWSQRDQTGRPVADGVYTAAVTTVDASGELRKRVERVVVGRDAQALAAGGPGPTAIGTITGEGTIGKIAKFTGANAIGNSVIAESAGKVGVGTTVAPTATLEINGPQPGPQPATGTDATPLLKTIGGKGGNSTTAGEIAGKGASISLLAGNGGNTVSGSTNGSGGNITLQGGSAGTGGTGGSPGNVLLAPTAGNVGIGISAPTSKLTVKGSALTNIFSAENTSTITGSIGVFGKGITGVYGHSTSCCSAGVYGMGNFGVHGKTNGASTVSAGVFGEATSDYGVMGKSSSRAGVYGESQGINEGGVHGVNNGTSEFGKGVFGSSNKGYGVYGHSTIGYAGGFEGSIQVTGTVEVGGTVTFGSDTRQMLHLYLPYYGIGVQNSTLYFRTNSGFGWYKGGMHNDTANSPGTGGTRLMKLDSAGNLTATSFAQTSDRNAKSNFSAVNPRAILDKLNSLPIQTWSYKADDGSVRHIGPVAQDFRAAFNLGADDKHISTVDADGVALAAIQGLYQLMLEKEKQNEEKDRKIEQLARKLEEIESRLAEVRRGARRQRAPRGRAR